MFDFQIDSLSQSTRHFDPGKTTQTDDCDSGYQDGKESQFGSQGKHSVNQPLHICPNAIAHSSDCFDQFIGEFFIYFFANTLNVHIDQIGVGIKSVVPDMLANLHSAEDSTGERIRYSNRENSRIDR